MLYVVRSVSSEDSEGQPEVRSRPKTRGAILSFADEDLELISEAIKDKTKGLKKWHAKLKAEFGRDKIEDDSDWELKQPKEDENLNYDVVPLTPVKKFGRGKGKSRRGKQRSRATIIKMKRGRARKKQPKPAPPEIVPSNLSRIEFEEMIYQIGDIVKVASGPQETNFAQIQGFFADQYCEKYVSVRWLIPKLPLVNLGSNDPASFHDGPVHSKPVSMRSLIYVRRPPPMFSSNVHHPKEIRNNNGPTQFMDSPSFTLSSVDHQWLPNEDEIYC